MAITITITAPGNLATVTDATNATATVTTTVGTITRVTFWLDRRASMVDVTAPYATDAFNAPRGSSGFVNNKQTDPLRKGRHVLVVTAVASDGTTATSTERHFYVS
jgi:hypothetical protein